MTKGQMEIDDGISTKSSNKKLILLGVALLAVIIIVGVLAGVLSAKREKDECDERVRQAVHRAKSEGELTSTTRTPSSGVRTTPGVRTTAEQTTSGDRTTVGPTTSTLKPWEKIRLPTDIVPDHYDMLIRVYLDTLRFSGNSNITINVTKATDKILFHINKINITDVEVIDNASNALEIDDSFPSLKRQFFVVILKDNLVVGTHELRLSFVANIETEELNGFYKSTYKNGAGETRLE